MDYAAEIELGKEGTVLDNVNHLLILHITKSGLIHCNHSAIIYLLTNNFGIYTRKKVKHL